MTSSLPGGDERTSADPLRVLVVDDLVDAAVTMARLLRLMECEVRTAHDGHTALTTASEFLPDVVLLDLGLPGLDGYEVARQLRSQPGTARSFIIALTGYGHAAARDDALAAGCDDHLLKPAGIDQLLALLNGRQRPR
jgi:CheY-like chemotaxis protein